MSVVSENILVQKSLNRHVNDIHKGHTKTADVNDNCTDECCTRSIGWVIQSGSGMPKNILRTEDEDDDDEDSDTSYTHLDVWGALNDNMESSG